MISAAPGQQHVRHVSDRREVDRDADQQRHVDQPVERRVEEAAEAGGDAVVTRDHAVDQVEDAAGEDQQAGAAEASPGEGRGRQQRDSACPPR